jgi:hypothetical protein
MEAIVIMVLVALVVLIGLCSKKPSQYGIGYAPQYDPKGNRPNRG